MNLSHTFKTVKHYATANSPALLLGTAIAGIVGTGVLAAKGGYKARGIIDAFEEIEERETSTQEKLQLTWLCYAAPALTGAGTIASAVGVHYIHTKRFDALAGIYAVTSNKLDDYQEKAEELLGAKKSQAVRDDVAQKNLERNGGLPNTNEIVITENGTELCHDEFAGRYFTGSFNKIEAAINEVNKKILTDGGSASLNDFYTAVGIDQTSAGELLGWSGTKIEARYGNAKELSPDGRPSIAYWFQPEPKTNYWKTHL